MSNVDPLNVKCQFIFYLFILPAYVAILHLKEKKTSLYALYVLWKYTITLQKELGYKVFHSFRAEEDANRCSKKYCKVTWLYLYLLRGYIQLLVLGLNMCCSGLNSRAASLFWLTPSGSYANGNDSYDEIQLQGESCEWKPAPAPNILYYCFYVNWFTCLKWE